MGVHVYAVRDETVQQTQYLQYELQSSPGTGLLDSHVMKLGTLRINKTAI